MDQSQVRNIAQQIYEAIEGGLQSGLAETLAHRRERIATAALAGLLACPDAIGDAAQLAGFCVGYADALIAALDKPTT